MLSKRLLLPLICLLLCSSAYAQTTVPTVPYVFSPSTAAKAEEVNADFAALETKIGQLEADISALQGQGVSATSIQGTYDIYKLGVKLADNGGGDYEARTSSFSGTVVFNGDGTGTFNAGNNSDTSLSLHSNTNGTSSFGLTNSSSPNSGSFSWTISGNKVTVSPSGGSAIIFAFNGGVAVGIDTSDGRDIYVVVKQ